MSRLTFNLSVPGLDNHDLSDYYFRDSFEHSSTESAFINSMNDTRLGPNRLLNHTSDRHTSHHSHAMNSNNASVVNQQNASNNAKNAKKFSLLNAFVPSFIFVIVVLMASTLFILESESDLFTSFKNVPEMVSLKYQYYQPLKRIVFKLLGMAD